MKQAHRNHKLAAQLSSHSINASGDGRTNKFCRLCGGNTSLKLFKSTYIWQGVEERYDRLMQECFGVTVFPPDSMICERCVHALRVTERFRSMVYAAFDRYDYNDELKNVQESFTSLATKFSRHSTLKQETTRLDGNNKHKLKINDGKKRAKKMSPNSGFYDQGYKKIQVLCQLCKHRYPMLITSTNRSHPYVCARCNKKEDKKMAMSRRYGGFMDFDLNDNAKEDVRKKNCCRIRHHKKEITAEYAAKEKESCIKCTKKPNAAQKVRGKKYYDHSNCGLRSPMSVSQRKAFWCLTVPTNEY